QAPVRRPAKRVRGCACGLHQCHEWSTPMNPISQIAPVTDAEAAGLAQPGAFAALADEIVSMAAVEDPRMSRAAHGSRRRQVRRSLMIGLPAAACLAVAGLIATSLGSPGQHVGPVPV